MKSSYKVVYGPEAMDDLRAIYFYIAFELKAGQAAKNQTERIRKAVRSLDNMPGRHSKVDWEPWSSMNMHQLPIDNYIVYYQVDNKKNIVTIIRIFYGGRNVEGIINSETE